MMVVKPVFDNEKKILYVHEWDLYCQNAGNLVLVSASAKYLFYYLANQHLVKIYVMYFQAN